MVDPCRFKVGLKSKSQMQSKGELICRAHVSFCLRRFKNKVTVQVPMRSVPFG